MTRSRSRTQTTTQVVGENPLEGEQLVLDALYGRAPLRPARRPPPEKAPPKEKPTHYKVVSISLYNEDIKNLEEMVRELKRRGHYKANKSLLIRQALAQVDLDKIAREG